MMLHRHYEAMKEAEKAAPMVEPKAAEETVSEEQAGEHQAAPTAEPRRGRKRKAED